MDTSFDCLSCFFRQALDAARRVSDDAGFHEQLLRQMALWIHEADLKEPPPVMAQRLYRHLYTLTGVNDPFADAKEKDNELALSLLPELKQRVVKSSDPFKLAVRLAIAGNLIDLGARSDLAEEEILHAINNVEEIPFSGDLERLRKKSEEAESIFYLADNAGEIVLDQLLIQQLGPHRITVAVRGKPILNDATMHDAETTGLTDIVTVISNGSDVPGTLLSECTEEVVNHFNNADLVISKGQGNFETLSKAPREICFLLKVKCSVIAEETGHPLGNQALIWHTPGTSC
jgi:uncharacterized protein with ATP-grasp and redox domains